MQNNPEKIATKNGHILRYTWEGQEKRDYSLDLKRIPFCTDQQVLKAVPLADKGVFVSKIAYSPLIGGYAVVFNDGRAAFLFSSTINFDPNVSFALPTIFENYSKCRIFCFSILEFSTNFCHFKSDLSCNTFQKLPRLDATI